MLKRVVTWFFLIPLALLFAFFALANRQEILLGVDPLSPDSPFVGPFPVPLFIVIYGALMLGIVLGGVGAYVGQHKKRAEVRALRKQNTELKQQLDARAPTTDKDDGLALLDDRV
ncbi:LapA family protein [Maritalea myrionectae]|uniref:LapA family protein n=1 Tax=Maritalea myrionectae TaxID=454601 RepID=UPI000401CF8D|nr:LapA family protein [Maritalea myrionectae]